MLDPKNAQLMQLPKEMSGVKGIAATGWTPDAAMTPCIGFDSSCGTGNSLLVTTLCDG